VRVAAPQVVFLAKGAGEAKAAMSAKRTIRERTQRCQPTIPLTHAPPPRQPGACREPRVAAPRTLQVGRAGIRRHDDVERPVRYWLRRSVFVIFNAGR
jgi:hypothetical protein